MNETYTKYLITKIDRKIDKLADLTQKRERELISSQDFAQQRTRLTIEINTLDECLRVFSELVAKENK